MRISIEGRQRCGGFVLCSWYKEGSPSEGDLLVSLGYHQLMGFVCIGWCLDSSQPSLACQLLLHVKAPSAENAHQGS